MNSELEAKIMDALKDDHRRQAHTPAGSLQHREKNVDKYDHLWHTLYKGKVKRWKEKGKKWLRKKGPV